MGAVIVLATVTGFFAYQSLSTGCTYTAGPLALFLRVVSDANQTPIAGASVAYSNTPLSCNGLTGPTENGQTFVTNGSEWHPLNIGEDLSSSIVVTYSGQTYRLSTGLGIEAVTCATLFIPSGRTNVTFGGFQFSCPPKSATTGASNSTSTSSMSTSTSSSLSVPPPTTAVIHYGCGVPSTPSLGVSSVVLVNTSRATNVDVKVGVSPTLSVELAACSYTYTNTTTPTACGVMCGGGVGYTYAVSDVLKLNFTLSSPGVPGAYNFTVASVGGLSEVFPGLSNEVYLNSVQITSWYSNPPCSGSDGIEGNCMTSNATSMTVELPSSITSGTYQLVVSSGEYLVP